MYGEVWPLRNGLSCHMRSTFSTGVFTKSRCPACQHVMSCDVCCFVFELLESTDILVYCQFYYPFHCYADHWTYSFFGVCHVQGC